MSRTLSSYFLRSRFAAPRRPRWRSALLLLALLGGAAHTSVADASISVALSIDDLAKESDLVVRATPIERTSAREDGRIVTTTRLRIDRVIAGTASASEVSVRTLGGIVDGIGQYVEGEASFSGKTPSIVFLRSRSGAHFAVAGRAQGLFVVVNDAKTSREIVRIRGVGQLVARPHRVPLALPSPSSLATAFDGRDANEVVHAAAQAWERNHAR